jgi:hypothetical protein
MRNILITGAHHEERMKYATSLAMKLLCNDTTKGCATCHNCQRVAARAHPNVFFIEPEEDSSDIKIDAVRKLIEESHKANFEAGNAVFIITHMHKATKASANALLKSIEESSSHKIFLALAPSSTTVLPTIRSRLRTFIIKPAPLGEALDTKVVDLIIGITSLSPTKRFAYIEQFPVARAELIEKLHFLTDTCHELLRAYYQYQNPLHTKTLAPLVILKLSEALHKALDFVQKNAHTRLVIEHLILSEWPYARL